MRFKTTKQKPIDIKKSGPQSYRDLQKQNAALQSGKSIFDNMQPVYQALPSSSQIYYGKEKSPILQSGKDYFGKSKYDEIELTPENWSAEAINQGRYNNQPWYDNIANGVAKMLGKTGTTFLDSVVGLPLGLIESGAAAAEGQKNPWSKIWDNEISKGMENINDWMEDNFKNYRSTEQQNSPWYSPSNLLSTSFIADDILDNAGFMLGSVAASMTGVGAVGTLGKILNLTGKIGKVGKGAASVLGALYSASGEAMTEAQSGVQERNQAELVRLGNSFLPEMDKLKAAQKAIDAEYQANKGKHLVRGNDGSTYDPALLKYRRDTNEIQKQWDEINKKYDEGKQQIEESGLRMGNKIFGLNQVLLTAGNLIQFGKVMGKGFRNAMHEVEEAAKVTKPFGVGAKIMKDGTYKVYNKNLMRGVNATKGLFTEGFEEMNQQVIQNYGGISENEVDVNDYWKAQRGAKDYRKTTKSFYNLGNEISKAFADCYGDVNQWEQFAVGALTGMLGMYAPSKLFNQDKTKSKWNPLRYGEWAGGAIIEGHEYNKKLKDYEDSISDVNALKKSKDFHNRFSKFVAHTKLEEDKTRSAQNGDMKAWKDADDKQMVHDIQAFARAGKLDDLRDIYNSVKGPLTDEDIDNIINITTRHTTAEQDKQRFNDEVNTRIAGLQQENSELNKQLADSLGKFNGLYPGETTLKSQYSEDIAKLNNKINQNNEEINSLKEQANNYEGNESYDGIFVDGENNRLKTRDEVREELSKNSQSLNRKLDNYIKSIAAVKEATGGTLTKDQEDNLAYLHYISAEKLERSGKIANNVRESLPKNLLFKTNKTPEQLAKEFNVTDLAFTKDKDTKDGYVKVDTSRLSDAKFVDFFVRYIINGENIINDHIKEALDKDSDKKEGKADKKSENKKLSDQIKEQLRENSNIIEESFLNKYRESNPRATELDVNQAANKFLDSLTDMTSLYRESADYYNTLHKYMEHPELIDKKKQEADEKAAKEVKSETTADKLRGKDNHQLSAGLQSGEIDVEDLDEAADFAFTPDEEGDDEETKNQKEENKKAAKEAKIAKEKHAKAAKVRKHALDAINELPSTKASEEDKGVLATMVDSAIASAEIKASDATEITLDSIDTSAVPFDVVEQANQEKLEELQKLLPEVTAVAFTRYNKDEVGAEDIPDEKDLAKADKSAQKAAETTKATGHDPVAANKVPFNFSDKEGTEDKDAGSAKEEGKDSNKEKDKKGTTEEKGTDKEGGTVDTEDVDVEDEDLDNAGVPDSISPDTPIAPSSTSDTNNPTTTVVNSDQAVRGEISTVNRQESSIENNNWRTTTMRNPYGRTEGTYHDDMLEDKNSAAYRRSKAIYEYLKAQGAWDRVDAVDDNLKLHEGDKVHIMVKFLPEVYGENTPFSSIPDEQKPYALALIMLDDKGNVLGDLPLAQWERDYYGSKKSEGLKNLIAFQNEAFKLFEDNYAKTGNKEVILDDFKKEGVDTLGVKKINGNPSTLSIKKMYNGLVPTSQEYNTVNEIVAGNGVQLGVITNEGVATGYNYKENKHITLTPGEQVRVPQAKTGRPMMLLDSPSGKQVAIPIVTDTFVADKDSLIYRVLHTALVEALKYNGNADISKQTFFQVCDLLSGLLQVDRFKNNKERGIFKKSNGKNTLTVNLRKAGVDDPSKENGTDYSFTIDSVKGVSLDTLADMILDRLTEQHIPIQVSTHYINKNIPLITVKNGKVEKEEIEYNKIIGELAKAPLPKGTTQVINNWFTLDYNPNSSTERQKMSPKADGIQTITVNNAPYTLDFNSHTIKNEDDKPAEFEEHEDLYKSYARAFAERAENKNKEVVYVVINGENYYYNKAEDKFVQRPGTENKTENTVTSDKEKEVNKEKSTEGNSAEKEKANKGKLEKKETKTSSIKLTIEDVEKEVSSFIKEKNKKVTILRVTSLTRLLVIKKNLIRKLKIPYQTILIRS